VKLRDDHAFGAVDDKLAAPEHDRHLAEIDTLFQHVFGVFADQAATDPERLGIGQLEIDAFLGGVARLAQLVVKIFQRYLPIVADNGGGLTQQGFQSFVLALPGIDILLQEARVTT